MTNSQQISGHKHAYIVQEDQHERYTEVSNDMSPYMFIDRGHHLNSGRQWKQTFLRFGPLSGVMCALLAIASLVAAMGILAGSDNATVAKWPTPPSTYLAICTAVANLSIRYAAAQGVAIAWWNRASSREGATLQKLHRDWRSGSSFRGAISAGRHAGLLGLACIFSTVVVIDGPLLQRASTVVSTPWVDEVVPLNISIAQELPRFFADSSAAPSSVVGEDDPWSYAFNDTVPTGDGGVASNTIYPIVGYSSNVTAQLFRLVAADQPLTGIVHGCPDSCSARIRAPAFKVNACTSHSIPVDHSRSPRHQDFARIDPAPPLYDDFFFISIGLVLNDKESLNLVTGFPEYSDTDKCTGNLKVTACTLLSAVGEYTVDITSDKATLLDPGDPTIIATANNSAVDRNPTNTGVLKSTLAAIVWLAFDQYDTRVSGALTPKGQVEMSQIGGASNAFLSQVYHSGCCAYSDPTEYLIKSLNKIMVYAGVASAMVASKDQAYRLNLESSLDPGLPLNTSTHGYRKGDYNVFRTHYVFFVTAALLELVCIGFIAPTYWGWWQLGRDVSFSPVEIAKAFRSPILADYNSNMTGRDIAESGKDVSLRYGAVKLDRTRNGTELAFDVPDAVSNPRNGASFVR